MSRLTPEYEATLRRAINPVYVDQRGTESYERAALLGEIDRLRAELASAKAPQAAGIAPSCHLIDQQGT